MSSSCDPMTHSLPYSLSMWDFPGRNNADEVAISSYKAGNPTFALSVASSISFSASFSASQTHVLQSTALGIGNPISQMLFSTPKA